MLHITRELGNPLLPGWFQLTCYRDKRDTLLSYGATRQVATARARQASGQLSDRQLFREHDPRDRAPAGWYYWDQPPTTAGMCPFDARLRAARATNHSSEEDGDSDAHGSSEDDEAHGEPGPGATAKRMRCDGGSTDADAASTPAPAPGSGGWPTNPTRPTTPEPPTLPPLADAEAHPELDDLQEYMRQRAHGALWEGIDDLGLSPADMLDALDAEQEKLGLVGVIKRAGRYVGVFLGCRCSEYLGPDIDWDKIIQTSDVRPMMGHQYCEWSDEFDGLMVTFRGSKTDQYNEGCKRYVGITGNSRCAVRAFREWYTLQPSHFERSDVVPMFTMPDGRVLGRTEMQNDLRRAALLAGLSDENIGTHSLRVSCATWLYQAGYDLEYIKRHGRWASNVVHVYLWEGSGFHTMCKKMSECKFVLHTNV